MGLPHWFEEDVDGRLGYIFILSTKLFDQDPEDPMEIITAGLGFQFSFLEVTR